MSKSISPKTIVLLPAFAMLPHAMHLLWQALELGEKEPLLCVFRSDLAQFLAPLEAEGIHIHYFESSFYPSFGHPLRYLCEKAKFEKEWKTTFAFIQGANVHTYCTSISVPAIVLGMRLSKRNIVHYEPSFEGRSLNAPLFSARCRGIKPIIQGWKWSLATSCPIAMRQLAYPVPVLSDRAVSKSFLSSTFKAPPSNTTAFLKNPFVQKLLWSPDVSILWLYTNWPDYWNLDKSDSDAFHASEEKIVAATTAAFQGQKIAVKGHPSYGYPYPHYFQKVISLPAGIPIDFAKFSQIRLVIATPSLALNAFLGERGKSIFIIDISKLLAISESRKAELQDYLDQRIPGSDVILQPKTQKEFIELLSNANISSIIKDSTLSS